MRLLNNPSKDARLFHSGFNVTKQIIVLFNNLILLELERSEDEDIDQIIGGTTVTKGNHRYMVSRCLYMYFFHSTMNC